MLAAQVTLALALTLPLTVVLALALTLARLRGDAHDVQADEKAPSLPPFCSADGHSWLPDAEWCKAEF